MVNPAVPGFQRIIDFQRVDGGALEFTLIQPRVELQRLQWLSETISIGLTGDSGRVLSLVAGIRVSGLDCAGTEQSGKK